MAVSILRQYQVQSGAPTIDTTGGVGSVWVIHVGTANDWWGTMKLNGNAGDHQAQLEDARTSTMVAMWRNPPISSSVSMSNEYNTYSENMTYVVDGCIDWDYQYKYYAQEPDSVSTSKIMTTGCLFTVARTGRSGYSCYPDQGETNDYDVTWRTYPAWMGHKHFSDISGSHYSSSGNNYDKLQTYFITGALGIGRIIMFFEEWKKRTALYQELLAKGAIDLGNRQLQPI